MNKPRSILVALASMCLLSYVGRSVSAQERGGEANRGAGRGNQAGAQHFPQRGPARGTAQPRPEARGAPQPGRPGGEPQGGRPEERGGAPNRGAVAAARPRV